MLDLTEYMRQTPFGTSTFKFVATDDTDKNRGFYYTPYQLTNWHYAENPESISSIRNFVHDISHIIDLYQRGSFDRLLKVDFGWKLTGYTTKVSDAAILTELRTITIQELLCRELFDSSLGRDAHNFWRKRLRKKRINPQFLRGRGAFDVCVDKLIETSDAIGVSGYLDIWKAACEFVETNRDVETKYAIR